ncbi:dihydroorotate dehydrogenase electron transfer subunit [Limisalsivibrio acetivorans]|uniref:dihydroorotate dehydrogenase electron transfer subunit n=1 Tax=Limisalsivibrio acetivorans TaxID=1304888 RepID=UPI0003B43C28|nr:dihydroorotate dehydrogenase electron transfer subunit [Limisalsivibrio acetivorans]
MKGRIIENKRLNSKYGLLTIESSKFTSRAEVGQFVMVKTSQQDYLSDPLLRRPLGIMDIEGDRFRLLYMIVGKGTMLLCDCMGEIGFSEPLGNGFKPVKEGRAALVAGGVGIAPLLWLAKELKSSGVAVDLYYGGRSAEDIVITEEFEPYVENMYITTENGDKGDKGLVTAPLAVKAGDYDVCYSCGPKGMLKAVSEICEIAEVPAYVSLEERMACGMGACLGCIIYTKGDGGIEQKRCCVEGPVFDGTKVVWESVQGK